MFMHIPWGWVEFQIGDIIIEYNQFGDWVWFTTNVLDTLIGC